MADRRGPVSWRALSFVLLLPVLAGAGVIALGIAASNDDPAPPEVVQRAAGSDEGHRFWDLRTDGTPVRWDPCSPIRWTFNPAGAPSYGSALVDEAVDVVARETGLEFERLPDTVEEPSVDRPLVTDDEPEAWAPVLVTWAPPHAGDVPLRTSDRAVSVPISVDGVFVTAQVVLNEDRDDLVPVLGDRATTWGATLVHELGHVVGLDHVDDPDQLMSRFPGEGPLTFGEGDRAGLARLGAGAGGCLDAGAPRDAPVRTEPRG